MIMWGANGEILFRVDLNNDEIPASGSIDAVSQICFLSDYTSTVLREILSPLKFIPDEEDVLQYKISGVGVDIVDPDRSMQKNLP